MRCMGALGTTWVILLFISIPAVSWLAHNVVRSQRADGSFGPDDDGPLTASGWVASVILCGCFIAFFLVGAEQFGPVVWFILILLIWSIMLWAIFTEFLPRPPRTH